MEYFGPLGVLFTFGVLLLALLSFLLVIIRIFINTAADRLRVSIEEIEADIKQLKESQKKYNNDIRELEKAVEYIAGQISKLIK
ncbi:MAG: hypothetical protein OXM55_03230 [Bdellovibrionales bacterium]|nr:hypothetical protein [Bdellovibrionales bacterium]